MRFGLLWIILGLATGYSAAVNTVAGSPQIPPAGPRLASPHQHYRLQLTSLASPSSSARGLLLKVRVDGGPMLRLLVDSGAESLVLDRRAARKLGHSLGAELDVIGAGGGPRTARLTTAGRIEASGIAFLDCPMVIVDGPAIEGVDGVIPLALFADFLVHLDIPRKVLELLPYPADRQDARSAFVRVREHRRLLFLKTRLTEARDGYLLLDTGSSYNLISNAAAAALPQTRAFAEHLSLIAGVGKTEGLLLSGPVSIRFGQQALALNPVVAMDLAEMSRRHGLDIAGVIGYPAFAQSALTVNYRESLVRIQTK